MSDDLIYGQYNRRKERVYFERKNTLDTLDNDKLFEKYRFTRVGIEYIIEMLDGELQPDTQRSHALSTQEQVLIALNFLSTGSFQRVVGDSRDLNVSQPTVSRVVDRFCRAVSSKKNDYITFPTSEHEIKRQNALFYQMGRIPNIVGCVDGTQVQIQAPIEHEDVYVNRNNYHSLNVQVICNSQSLLTNVIAKWPGCTHDSTIMTQSFIPEYFESGGHRGLLLGDSGYACTNWLLTPYREPVRNATERKFNKCHKKIRSLVERTIGQLKRKWACLHGEIRVSPKKASVLIMCCCVLHNIGKMLQMPDVEGDENDGENNNDHPGQLLNIQEDTTMRDHIASLLV